MKEIKFLILGKNQAILDILIRLVNADDDWNAIGFSDEELAKDYFQKNTLDFVLLSSGIDEGSEIKIRNFFITQQPEIEIIQHYGGGSGLLRCEILEILEKRRIRKLSENQV